MRFFWLALLSTGCAFISDKHEAWRLDPDEDGVDIRSDCDDDDGALGLPIEWYFDQDEDGFGAAADMKRQCTQPEGYVQNAEDCDDTNPDISPLAEEVCDLIDNDCDLQVDEDVNTMLAYTDDDGDGFGDASTEQLVCMLADGQVLNGDDCDDANPRWQVQQPIEVFYNGIDDNCSDADLDGDQDGDGFWVLDYADRVVANGGEPMDVAPEAQGDCIDDDPEIHPGALDEPYDGQDQDCKGEDDYDQDRDGYVPEEYFGLPTAGVAGSGSLPGGDCNDYLHNVRPGLMEDCSTPHDDDCNGSTNGVDARGCIPYFEDYDRDGFGGTVSQCQCESDFVYSVTNGNDCDDNNEDAFPGAEEIPYDGIDQDCAYNDDFDVDKDGYVSDEHVGEITVYAPFKPVEGSGMLRGGDCDDLDGSVNPSGVESCLTDADDDCDGSNNAPEVEGCSLFHLDADDDGFGHPTETLCACAPYREYRTTDSRDCDDDDSSTHPGAEDAPYDAIDSDCAGDDDFDHDGDGYAKAGHEGEETLMGGRVVAGTGTLPGGDCDDADRSIYPDADEFCDGADNDCDGEVDEPDALDAKYLFVDADGDGFGDGDEASRSRACSVSEGIVDVAGDCNDDDDSIHPGAEEICDGIDQDCDGDLVGPAKDSDADGLPDCISPPYIPDVAPVVLVGTPATQAGESLHIDAVGRLAIGAPTPADGNAHVYVMNTVETGALDGALDLSSPMRVPGWGADGTTEPSGFGKQLASMPSVSGDGVDLVVAAPYDSAVISIRELGASRTIAWPSSTGELWALEAEPPGTTEGDCGTAVAGGMFSRDADESPSPGLVVTCAGSAYVFNQDTWSDDERLFGIIGTEIVGGYTDFYPALEDEGFGASVATGDFNGDGIDDVAIGSDHGPCPPTDAPCSGGAVYVYMGPHDIQMDLSDADVLVNNSENRLDDLGHALLAVDLTGDGKQDLLVATDKESTGVEEKNGAVLLFDGDAMQEELAHDHVEEEDAHTVIYGAEKDSWFGFAMAAVSDLDGDDVPEVIISAPKMDGPAAEDGEDHGALYGFFGPWVGGSRSIDANTRVLFGAEPDAELGRAVAVGDIGLDGVFDIAVAEPDDDMIYVLPAADWLLD